MTPQPHPKYLLITEDELRKIILPMYNSEIYDRVRSRPTPSPKTRMEAYDKFVRDTLKPHVDAIKANAAAQAREKVLEELETFVRSDHSLNRQIGKRIMIAKIQSLRTGGDE